MNPSIEIGRREKEAMLEFFFRSVLEMKKDGVNTNEAT